MFPVTTWHGFSRVIGNRITTTKRGTAQKKYISISTQAGRDESQTSSYYRYGHTLCTMEVMRRSRLEHCRGFRSDECIFLMHTGHLTRANSTHAETGEKQGGERQKAATPVLRTNRIVAAKGSRSQVGAEGQAFTIDLHRRS